MRLVYTQSGPPAEVLREADDQPGSGVAVRLIARPVHPMDLLQLRGLYPWKVTLPAVAGAAGCGRALAGSHAGKLVLLPIRWGTWCHVTHVPEEQLLVLPDHVDPVQASQLVVNGISAHFMLEGLGEGDHVVQSPGGGAVGQLVDQLCAQRGIGCTNLVRQAPPGPLHGPAVTDLPPRLGATRALDGVGGSVTADLGAGLRSGGSVWHYGAMSRQAPRLRVADLIFRDVQLRGFWLRRETEARGAAAIREALAALATGGLSVAVAGSFPLHAWRDALALAQSPERRGQVMLVDPEP